MFIFVEEGKNSSTYISKKKRKMANAFKEKESTLKVEIRPIAGKKKWHGKTGKESFTRPNTIQALVSKETGLYNTGLTEKDIERLKKANFKYDLDPQFDPEKPHEFWDSKRASIKLENKTMFLKPEDSMIDFIKVRIAKASKFVANSQEDYDNGLAPHATHIIYDEKESVKIKSSKIATKKAAILGASKLNTEKKIQIIMILGGKDVKGKSADFIEVALDEIVDESPAQVLEFLNSDADNMEVHALVLECLTKSVLTKKGHKIEYNGSNLGGEVEEVVEYLSMDENNDLRLRLTAAVQ